MYDTTQMSFTKASLIVPFISNRNNDKGLSLSRYIALKPNYLHVQPLSLILRE